MKQKFRQREWNGGESQYGLTVPVWAVGKACRWGPLHSPLWLSQEVRASESKSDLSTGAAEAQAVWPQ